MKNAKTALHGAKLTTKQWNYDFDACWLKIFTKLYYC